MANTSRWPITIDGVRLDTLAYNIETRQGRAGMPETKGEDVESNARHGVLWTANKKYGPGHMVLRMWVGGTTVDEVAVVDDYALYRTNLDMLLRLFGTKHRLLDVRQTVAETGPVVRQALCQVVTVIDPETIASSPYTERFTVELSIPGAFWTDVADTTYDSGSYTVSGTLMDLSASFGASTAPMTDLYLVVDGPVTNPKVFDGRSGHYVKYNGTVALGSQWCVNTTTWSSKVGVGIAFTDTGTDVYALTEFAGAHSPRLFGIVSDPAGPQAYMEGTGLGASTKFRIRGKRTYL